MNTKVRSDKAEARTQAQRERILQAAQCCFIEYGFHAASMARIAETAGMSPGLIYRYFDSKSAIIQAIVERQLDLLREDIRLSRHVDLAREATDAYGSHRAPDGRHLSATLMLEISAEATRDPRIAEAVRNFDSNLRRALEDWLSRPVSEGGSGVPIAEAKRRALTLQLVLEGLRVRETREPELDRELLLSTLHNVISRLLQP